MAEGNTEIYYLYLLTLVSFVCAKHPQQVSCRQRETSVMDLALCLLTSMMKHWFFTECLIDLNYVWQVVLKRGRRADSRMRTLPNAWKKKFRCLSRLCFCKELKHSYHLCAENMHSYCDTDLSLWILSLVLMKSCQPCTHSISLTTYLLFNI